MVILSKSAYWGNKKKGFFLSPKYGVKYTNPFIYVNPQSSLPRNYVSFLSSKSVQNLLGLVFVQHFSPLRIIQKPKRIK